MVKINLKTFKLLSISLWLVMILSSCSLPGISASPTQTIEQNLAGNATATSLQNHSTQTQTVIIIPTNIAAPATATKIQPNTPVWSAYNFTCDLVSDGSNMTMNLAWADRSDNEKGYIIYRDRQAIATLAPNSISYVDITYVAPGKTLSYSVEAFNTDWRASTSTITYGCQ